MRDPKVIQAEIAKLEGELADVLAHESMTRSAVYILKNLGWTWTRKGGWKKPEPKMDFKTFDKDSMTHIKAGDWVKIDTGTTGGYGYVRNVSGNIALVSFVERVTFAGAVVQESSRMYTTNYLKVVSHTEIVRALTGK